MRRLVPENIGPLSATAGRAGHCGTDKARQLLANNVSLCLVGLTQDFCEVDTVESLEALSHCSEQTTLEILETFGRAESFSQ